MKKIVLCVILNRRDIMERIDKVISNQVGYSRKEVKELVEDPE